MRRFGLSPKVESDLEEILQYVAQDNVTAADRLEERFFTAMESLASNPALGHRRQDLTALNLRFWPVGAYLIIYRESHHEVEIVAVMHGARDVMTVLRAR